MAARRSRLQIKPNLGPKLGRPSSVTSTTPNAKTKDGIADKKANISDKEIIQNSQTSESDMTVIKSPTEKTQSKLESENKQSPLKSPNLTDGNDGKTIPVRGVRNRLPKAKPIIAPRGTPKLTISKPVSPVKQISSEKLQSSPIKTDIEVQRESVVRGDKSTTITTTVIDNQDENIPIDITSNVSSTNIKTIDKKPITKKTERKLKRHKNSKEYYQQFPEHEPPDRQKMKMVDLIYWNPSKNPMKRSNNSIKKRVDNTIMEDSSPNKTIEDNSANKMIEDSSSIKKTEDSSTGPDIDNMEENTNDSILAPQVTIGPDGNMIINEQSLVIETEKLSTENFIQSDVVEDDDMFVNYNSFRNKGPISTWHDNETARFFRALSALGTDFSLMSSLFPHRSRKELKNKFKREEKHNRHLVDAAIKSRTPLSLDSFESIESVLERDKQEQLEKKRKPVKRKKVDMEEDDMEPIVKKPKEKPAKAEKTKKSSKTETSQTEATTPRNSSNRKKSQKSNSEGKKTSKKKKDKEDEDETYQPNNSHTEYDFDSDEDIGTNSLPNLRKSRRSTTAAKKLHEVCQSQPGSDEEDDDDDDDDDENEDVDVTDTDSDVDNNDQVDQNKDEAQDKDTVTNTNEIINSVSNNDNNIPLSVEDKTVDECTFDSQPPPSFESSIYTPEKNKTEIPDQTSPILFSSQPQSSLESVVSESTPTLTTTTNKDSSTDIQDIIQTESKEGIKPTSNSTNKVLTRRKKIQPKVNIPSRRNQNSQIKDSNIEKVTEILKTEVKVENPSDMFVSSVAKDKNISTTLDTSTCIDIKPVKVEPIDISDISIPSCSFNQQQMSSATNLNVQSTSKLTNAKNKSKTMPISQKNKKSDIISKPITSLSEAEILKGSGDPNLLRGNQPPFVLPANIFPNQTFNQDQDKMQMVLVPETKDGETIYHVYMIPESVQGEGQTVTISNVDVTDTMS